MADFIWIDNKSIVIFTNNIISFSDLQEIEGYVKNSSCVDADQINIPRLPQSKSYLKIVGISYLSKQLNSCLFSEKVKNILKSNYTFNNIVLASKPNVMNQDSKG